MSCQQALKGNWQRANRMNEVDRGRLLVQMERASLDSRTVIIGEDQEWKYSVDWYGKRPFMVKVAVGWAKSEEHPGVRVQYQAECKHGVRGQRPFEKWNELTKDERMDTVPICGNCVAEIVERERIEEEKRQTQQKLDRHKERKLRIRRFFRKEWKWVVGFVLSVIIVVLTIWGILRGN